MNTLPPDLVHDLTAIVELIESPTYPARRLITDYVITLLPLENRMAARALVDELYAKFDAMPDPRTIAGPDSYL